MTTFDVPMVSGDPSDFDFLQGSWRVTHRRLTPEGTWAECTGTMRHRTMFGGSANVEENDIDLPGGPYQALTIRAFDAESGQWWIWWLDSRSPASGLGVPMQGGFAGGDEGLFYAEEEHDGEPVLLRFVWRRPEPGRATWEQATSADGVTWSTNWTMDFTADP